MQGLNYRRVVIMTYIFRQARKSDLTFPIFRRNNYYTIELITSGRAVPEGIILRSSFLRVLGPSPTCRLRIKGPPRSTS